MRTILILALIVGVLAAMGIIHFNKRGDRLDVSIDTGELEEKTEDLIDAVKEKFSDDDVDENGDESVMEGAVEKLEDRIGRARDAVDEFADEVKDKVRDARRRNEK